MPVRLASLLVLLASCIAPVGAARAASPRIAILPIVVHATGEHEYLQAGIAEMLFSRMGRMDGISVVRVDDPASATTDLQAAREAGRAVGADFVLFGSFTRFGEGASLDVQCTGTAADGEPPRRVFVQSGTLGDIIPKLDDLAVRVGRYVASGGKLPAVAAAPPLAPAPVAPPPRAADDGAPGDGERPPADLMQRIEALERVVFPTHLGGNDIRGDGGDPAP